MSSVFTFWGAVRSAVLELSLLAGRGMVPAGFWEAGTSTDAEKSRFPHTLTFSPKSMLSI
jgi:hypothetical protein